VCFSLRRDSSRKTPCAAASDFGCRAWGETMPSARSLPRSTDPEPPSEPIDGPWPNAARRNRGRWPQRKIARFRRTEPPFVVRTRTGPRSWKRRLWIGPETVARAKRERLRPKRLKLSIQTQEILNESRCRRSVEQWPSNQSRVIGRGTGVTFRRTQSTLQPSNSQRTAPQKATPTPKMSRRVDLSDQRVSRAPLSSPLCATTSCCARSPVARGAAAKSIAS